MAAVDDDVDCVEVRRVVGGKKQRNARDVVGFTNSPQGRSGFHSLGNFRVVPQGTREIRPDDARSDTIDPDVVGPQLDRKIACELEISGLRDVVGRR